MSKFLTFAEMFLREWMARPQRYDPDPAVWCWKCGGVRAADHGFMRLICRTCGVAHEYGARWRDE